MTIDAPRRRFLVPLCLIAALASPPPAGAACLDPIELYANPGLPDSRSAVLVQVVGYAANTCLPVRESLEVDSLQRTLTLVAERPTVGCEPSAQRVLYRIAAETPVLEPGAWTFRFSIRGENCLLSRSLTVVSARQSDEGDRTAASLLFPYFQVDLADENQGPTTLFAVGNGSSEEALAHVVLWTDRGIPTLAFEVHLPAHGVQTVNLRDVFERGRLPVTDPGGAFPACGSPIALPALGATRRAELIAQHTGQPHPGDGLCYGTDRRGPGIATGFVTVDLVNRCSQGLTYPTSFDGEYFAPGGSGIAASRNVLYGDYFFLDVEGRHAQGFEAVPLVADADLGDGGGSFYTQGAEPGEDRVPLSGRYRTRFLSGGPFEGNTTLVIWRGIWELRESAEHGPRPCDEEHSEGFPPCFFLNLTLYDESGGLLETKSLPTNAVTGLYEIGGEDLPVATPFGSAVVENLAVRGCGEIQFGLAPSSAWVTPLLAAEGKYSVGFRAIPLD